MRAITNAWLSLVIALPAGDAQYLRAAEAPFAYFRSDGGLQTGAGPLPDRLDAPDALAWRVSVDSGHSTPVLRSGKIFLTTYRPDSKELAVLALDEMTGRQLWR